MTTGCKRTSRAWIRIDYYFDTHLLFCCYIICCLYYYVLPRYLISSCMYFYVYYITVCNLMYLYMYYRLCTEQSMFSKYIWGRIIYIWYIRIYRNIPMGTSQHLTGSTRWQMHTRVQWKINGYLVNSENAISASCWECIINDCYQLQ